MVKARRPRISTRLDFTPPRLPLISSHRSPLLLFPTPRSPSQTLSLAQTVRTRTNSTHAEDPKDIFRGTEDKKALFSVSCRQTSKKKEKERKEQLSQGQNPSESQDMPPRHRCWNTKKKSHVLASFRFLPCLARSPRGASRKIYALPRRRISCR
ncbi:hypothetical protein M430DRAFT_236497 [Amorphotheca resinae ATCC 22711]|uniref:Uncharacterized protein n=1 Tax=Amorphotheca resinae ATCC 22711 TaxID=857342 RepID=A0A2T3B4T3_AMORE|nr:hypothetical protein M430DRAFT_236497 [Amorphotheca resinae ATCC 22711]PSS20647.1 hypothetical protein M430DRAFT_236497 [Amorphotheca resinae ATCC 22711]